MSKLYIMATICSRKNRDSFVKIYEQHGILIANVSFGRGTASGDVLDYLGLEDDEKYVHLCAVTGETWTHIKKDLQSRLRIDVPGTGIVFLIPIASAGGKKTLGLLVEGQTFEKEEESTLKGTEHELIVAIANYGYNDQVMKAAREAGATGGTVLHGKGVGMKHAEQFLGVSLVTEKEIILIVTKTSQKCAVMDAITEKAGIHTKAGAIVLSLPVTDTAGLRIIEEADELTETV